MDMVLMTHIGRWRKIRGGRCETDQGEEGRGGCGTGSYAKCPH